MEKVVYVDCLYQNTVISHQTSQKRNRARISNRIVVTQQTEDDIDLMNKIIKINEMRIEKRSQSNNRQAFP